MKAEKERPVSIKVRALSAGYIGDRYRPAGDVFTIEEIDTPITAMKDGELKAVLNPDGTPKMRKLPAEKQFSPRWMERVTDEVPEKVTGARTLLKIETEEMNSGPTDHVSIDDEDA